MQSGSSYVLSQGVSAYAVEEVIWATLCGSWLILRYSISPAGADLWTVLPSAVMAFVNLLLCSSLPNLAHSIESKFFQFVFGHWLAALTSSIDIASSSKATSLVLADPYFSMASLACSLALTTILMLSSAAAVSPEPWKCTPPHLWADIFVIMSSSFQSWVLIEVNPGGSYALISFSILTVAAVSVKFWSFADVDLKLPLTLSQILEIISFSLEFIASATAVGLAYTHGTTSFAFAVGLAIAYAALVYRLVAVLNEKKGTSSSSHSDENHASAPPDPEIKSKNSQQQADSSTPSDSSNIRTMNSSMSSFPHLSSRVAGDALLFSKTKSLSSKLKKNS
jgi:hypothetical protein